ncbi:hypothetical protein M5D96_008530 [Drosophila gunungcola]|uniref:Uncharacterized protein n=1 Tax=Drosophila gunungcola TaxID=103775 RepID=A0A9P9YKH2_9MUSC|nr:hypothetical protein M5D96_008530 [Drosophila gunungcola]
MATLFPARRSMTCLSPAAIRAASKSKSKPFSNRKFTADLSRTIPFAGCLEPLGLLCVFLFPVSLSYSLAWGQTLLRN